MGQVGLDGLGGASVGVAVGADGVVDVLAAGVEQAGAVGGLGDVGEQGVAVVPRHGDDVVGLVDQLGGDPSAGVVAERSAQGADDLGGVRGGGLAIDGRQA